MNLGCFFGVDVLGRQQMPRKVGSDRQNGQVERPVLISDFLEDFRVSCVSRVKYFLLVGCFDDESSPKPSVVIEGRSP